MIIKVLPAGKHPQKAVPVILDLVTNRLILIVWTLCVQNSLEVIFRTCRWVEVAVGKVALAIFRRQIDSLVSAYSMGRLTRSAEGERLRMLLLPELERLVA